jgi:diaminopimelate epimerase
MKFTKMQGAGNDYIYVNGFEEQISDLPRAAIQVSDRHFGIGADGLIVIAPSSVADFRMRMFNDDGSEGKMCGNGTRCIARYVHDFGLTDKTNITLETLSGIKTIQMHLDADGAFQSATVNMGAPILTPSEIPSTFAGDVAADVPLTVDGQIWRVTAVGMGNPHCVTFLRESPETLDLPRIGPAFEHHSAFPERVNTEFCLVHSPTQLEMRVWERGSGETLACGTGASATAVAAILLGHAQKDSDITLRLRGGELTIRWDSQSGDVFMTGPAEVVCSGEIAMNN